MMRICTHCGYEGEGKRILRGSRSVEWFLWIVLLIPGPFYSLWRRFPSVRQCPHCQGKRMVSLKTTEGILAQRYFEDKPVDFSTVIPPKKGIEAFMAALPPDSQDLRF